MRKGSSNSSLLPENVIKQRKIEILQKEDMLSFAKKIFVIILAVLFITNFLYGIYVVKGQSMYPAVKDGDLVIYYKATGNYIIGDVVVLKKGKSTYISRIVAYEGDIVEIGKDGTLVVNGYEQTEEIYFDTYSNLDGISFPFKVPDGSVFVLGDFRTGATDSRNFAEVYKSEILGKVITILRRRGI